MTIYSVQRKCYVCGTDKRVGGTKVPICAGCARTHLKVPDSITITKQAVEGIDLNSPMWSKYNTEIGMIALMNNPVRYNTDLADTRLLGRGQGPLCADCRNRVAVTSRHGRIVCERCA